MSRPRKSRTRTRKAPAGRGGRRSADPAATASGPGLWGQAKAVLICGAVGGLVGGAIDAALGTDGYALPAAMIGGIPLGIVGAVVLGWSGRRFGARRRVRNGGAVGAALGLLAGASLGMVAGLSAWAFVWSVPGAIAGAGIQWALTGRVGFRLWPGAAFGALVGILARVMQIGPVGVMTNAIDGTLVGAVLGVVLLPALLALIERTSEFRRGRRIRG